MAGTGTRISDRVLKHALSLETQSPHLGAVAVLPRHVQQVVGLLQLPRQRRQLLLNQVSIARPVLRDRLQAPGTKRTKKRSNERKGTWLRKTPPGPA